MLTEKQKKDFEKLFNSYSLWKESSSGFRTEYSNKMTALICAVSILGYKFKHNRVAKSDGIEYIEYGLVEIGIWVAFIDKN